MTRQWLNGNAPMVSLVLQLVNTLGLMGIMGLLLWFGGWRERIEAHMRADWCTAQQAAWVRQTERENPNWRGADAWSIHQNMQAQP